MPKPIQTIIKLHEAQQAVVDQQARFTVVVCGRRWGKTELGKQLVYTRLQNPRLSVWWLTPTYQMAGQVWRDFKRHFRGQAGVTITEAERQIDFEAGGLLAIRSTFTPDNLRGAGLDYAVLDEAAFMPSHVWGEIVRPMLLDKQGQALFISSPNGKNWLWEVYQLGLVRNAMWASFRYPSATNSKLNKDDLHAIQQTSTERVWRQEYEAEFIDDSGQVFRGIRACAIAPLDATPIDTHQYVAGIDWGREGDYTVMVILDADTRTMVAMDRFNQVGWEVQRSRLQHLCERWHVATVYAEANSIGSVNIEALERENVPIVSFTTTVRTKAPLIDGLVLAIERGDIRLQADETLINELSAYRMKRALSGIWQYSAPLGGHDDCVIALALAWHAVNAPRLRLDFA